MDALFYEYGVKPVEKEFENYDKKVAELMKGKGFDYTTGFLVWQIFKLRKLTEKLNEVEIRSFNQPREESHVG